LNDGRDEGLSFTLSSDCPITYTRLNDCLKKCLTIHFQLVECLTTSKDSSSSESKINSSNVAMDNMETNSRWMYRLLMDSATPGSRQSQVILHTASMSFQPNSKLSAKASEKISQDFGQATASDPAVDDESSTTVKPANKITFYSPLYLIFRKLNLI
jgi:DNA-binding SARP family transcriptional activator